MRLIQFINASAQRHVGLVEADRIQVLDRVSSTYELFWEALNASESVAETTNQLRLPQYEDYQELLAENRVLLPLDHPDPYHTWITGTGLTHLGSATARNTMHAQLQSTTEAAQTDTMRLFRLGVENGKMKGTTPASQPEWFYKGNGLAAVPPGHSLPSPTFALDGGEEPEIVGLYIIDQQGTPHRIGFALANEFSDHQMERQNYLYLAHSKLRACSYGPELLLGELPRHVAGTSRILREGKVAWEREFLSGEANMSHNLANLEHHHFKYDLFRQPGDVHVHFFGTAVLSFTDGFQAQPGDVFEIQVPAFGAPLRNPLSHSK